MGFFWCGRKIYFFSVKGKFISCKKKKFSFFVYQGMQSVWYFGLRVVPYEGRRRLLELSVNLRERKTCIFAWGVGVLQEASNKFWFLFIYLFILDLRIVHKLRRICKSWISVTKWENKESYMYVRAKKKKKKESFFIRETHTKWFFFFAILSKKSIFYFFFVKYYDHWEL